MLDSVSPYALLCASKPKPTPTTVTPYDLYSAVQSSPPPQMPPAPAPVYEEAPPAPPQPAPRTPASMPMVAARRTHYIADIKSRHNTALKRTSMSACPISPSVNPPSGR